VFASVIIALTIWAAARLSLSLGGNFLLTAVSTLVLLGTTSVHWLARPHLLSWLLAIAALAVAEHERRFGTRWLYAVPVLAFLWANLHGSFPLLPGILFLYAIGSWLATGNPRSSFRFAAASLASLLATFVNPYGWRLHEYFLAYLNNSYLMDHIGEYRSFSFHSPGATYVELFLLIAVLGTLALLKQRAYAPALLAMGFLHLSLYSARHLPMAAVLLLPLSVSALTVEVKKWPRWAAFISYSDRLQAIDAKVWGAVPVAVSVIAMLFGVNAMANRGLVGFDASVFPVHAAEFLEKQPTAARIFSQDQWGGYLIYRFSGRRKVFLDGRGDFYGREMLEAYGQVMEVGPDWDAVLKAYDVHFVLIPADHALGAVLKLSPAWKQVYDDPVAAVFERVGRSPAS
jgi:hypothetical protein